MTKIAKKKGTKTEVNKSPKPKVISTQLQKKLDGNIKKRKHKKREKRGVVLLRHLPKGFHEDHIKDYFSQFGHVTRVRLARSRKTGGFKCYAFVEFRLPEVAKIAAESMNNYLMFQKLVKAHYIPPEEQKHNYFKTSVREIINEHGKKVIVSRKILAKGRKVKKYNEWTDEVYSKRISKALNKLKKVKEKYSDLGLDFDSVVIKPKLAVPPEQVSVENEDQNKSSDLQEIEEKPLKFPLIKKRKTNEGGNEDSKKLKGKSSLQQLLENNYSESDSSSDEDYLPVEDYDPSESLDIPPNAGIEKPLLKDFIQKINEAEIDSDSDNSFKVSDIDVNSDDSDSEEVSDECSEVSDIDDNSDDSNSEEVAEECSDDTNGQDSEAENSDDKKSDNSNSHSDDSDEGVVKDYMKNKKKFKQPKIKKVSGLEQIIRRKPHLGAITKKKLQNNHQKRIDKSKSIQKTNKMKAMSDQILKDTNLVTFKKGNLKLKKKTK